MRFNSDRQGPQPTLNPPNFGLLSTSPNFKINSISSGVMIYQNQFVYPCNVQHFCSTVLLMKRETVFRLASVSMRFFEKATRTQRMTERGMVMLEGGVF